MVGSTLVSYQLIFQECSVVGDVSAVRCRRRAVIALFLQSVFFSSQDLRNRHGGETRF